MGDVRLHGDPDAGANRPGPFELQAAEGADCDTNSNSVLLEISSLLRDEEGLAATRVVIMEAQLRED